ncbi:MAG TPA: hypothetical protein VKU86_15565 [Acidimicrobiales bacterium]|nr:hypothetical protein [Acidimicrobiales bacterium]
MAEGALVVEDRGTVLSRAEPVVRRLLLVPPRQPRPARRDEAAAHRLFNVSIAVSGLRCLLAYVVFPIVGPALDGAAGWGPAIGIPIGVVALVFDVVAVRRFWVADHRWRWGITAIYLAVIALVLTLLVRDLIHVA